MLKLANPKGGSGKAEWADKFTWTHTSSPIADLGVKENYRPMSNYWHG